MATSCGFESARPHHWLWQSRSLEPVRKSLGSSYASSSLVGAPCYAERSPLQDGTLLVEYVDLKRSFIPVGKDAEPDLTIGRAWGHKLGGWLQWSDLLDHQRVVLLAEASSGKSAEFKHTAAALCGNGASAFYSTIEQLAAGRLGFGQAEQELYDRWKSGSDHAWFFLDSVDEARLNQKKFDDALRSFSVQIGPALSRISVLVSCRASDWKGNSDRSTILDILPIPKKTPIAVPPEDPDAALLDPIFDRDKREAARNAPEENKKEDKPDVLVVQLVPLSDDQRRLLAQACGITDIDAFIAAIELQGLDVLSERPGDVIDLAQYWSRKGKFGTLSSMTEHTVITKLNEPDKYRPDNSALPFVRARLGAERLAAALTLGKSFTLLAAGHEPDPTLAIGALDPTELLVDWTVAEINALSRRGIFAPSTYGRIRFHHRSTQEYLTGKWLNGLLAQGCPLSAVHDLLFAERYGVKTVVPSMRSAAAWLALEQPNIRDEIIHREPLLLVTHGDPTALPGDVKAKLLVHLATRHVAGNIADDSIDRRSMWMFASPDLADAIHEAWKINDRPEFRADLVRLVREGKLKGCIGLAATLANDKTARDYHRIVGLQALAACEATAEIRTLTQALLRKPFDASPQLASGFAEVLFPTFISALQLLTLIERSKAHAHSTEGFSHVIDDLWMKCPDAQRTEFMTGLADLCLKEPLDHSYHRVSKRFSDLAKQLTRIAHHAMIALSAEQAPPSQLMRLLSVVERAEQHSRLDNESPALKELVQRNAKVQQELFWHDVAEVRRHSTHSVAAVWDIQFGGETLWSLTHADLPWLRDDLRSRSDENDRRVALSAIVYIVRDKLRDNAAAIRKLIGKNAALKKDLTGYLATPKKSAMLRRHERQSAKHKIVRNAQEVKDRNSWKKFRDELLKDPSKLSDAKQVLTNTGFSRLRNLSQWLHRKTGKDFPDAVVEWKLLEPAFSPAVATNFRNGMKALWRLTPPEGPKRAPGGPTTTKWTTLLSYAAAGLDAAEGPAFAAALTDVETERAALHACLSDQGYPPWIDALMAVRPKIVVPIVRKAFLREWTAEENAPSYLVYRFAQSSMKLDANLQPELLDIILTVTPPTIEMLERGISIVRNLDLKADQRTALKTFAVTKFRHHANAEPYWALRYLALLFLIDVPAAVSMLVAWLKAKSAKKHGNLVLKVLGILFGSHHPLVAASLEEAPISAVVQLVLFAYQAVRPEDDVVHEGMYQPNERDDAEGARGTFLKVLTEKAGRAAYEAMLTLSRHRDLRSRRIRFRELARRMAERDAEHLAWNANEILAFERHHISPIKTGLDLYRLTQSILAQITWDFDNANASSRAVLETAKDEDAVQEYLAEQFRLRARDRYHTARESEIAEGNMPDIIIAAVGAPVEVAIEGKHGGKGWSTNSLEDALRKQLSEDYLRPENRRHGLLVISNHKRRGWLHPVSKKNINFTEMIAYLQGVAATIVSNSVGGISVTVVGIDALPRQRKRSTKLGKLGKRAVKPKSARRGARRKR
jgi:hypothetical protein